MTPPAGTVVSVDGRRLRLTNLDKVMYPEAGTTKADVLDYYTRVSAFLLPHAAWRPVTRKRWVHGVGTPDEPAESFFQKNIDVGAPDWVQRHEIKHSDHTNVYPLLNDTATLIWLAQNAALELHVPQWQFGRTGIPRNPDRLVLDLDPGEGMGLAACAEVARHARSILVDMGLDPMPVTSGSKGIHLYAALDGAQDSAAVSSVAHELARALEADHPDLVVSDMKRSLRPGRVFVDWSQNNSNKTTITPYSLRGRMRPTVAAPRTWAELESPGLAHLEYPEVLARLERDGDPMAGLAQAHLSSLEPTPEHMARFAATDESRDRLAKYRSMRDATKTSEPMPPDAPAFSDGMTFVIQEHHARRTHFDFRLEHEGVLVSWAVPKGPPTDGRKNHLAVQTEDHPLEYGTFEGTIPSGEYGGGEVFIWDSGTYELEKWREGKEVIVTLHGEKHGTNRYALIHTNDNNWLMHLMAPQGSTPTAKAPAASPATPARKRTISPMLATLGSTADLLADADDDHPDEWAIEMKWDGIRAVAHVENGGLRLVSRNGNDLTAAYPDLAGIPDAVETADGDAVLDGEIIVQNAKGRPDFGLLQTRMNLTKPAEVDAAAAAHPAKYVVFDLLEASGERLTRRPWADRRALLEQSVAERGPVQLSPVFLGDVDAAMAASLELGLEGVMAKKRDGTYTVGRRSRSWIKIKHHLTQEVVIGGWRPGRGRRQGLVGSLLLGIPDGDGLHYVGRVGTGFTDREVDEITARLAPLARKTTPFDDVPRADASDAHWLTPRLVGEVEFAEWTSTGRLRHPSWRGWRDDKSPAEVLREES